MQLLGMRWTETRWLGMWAGGGEKQMKELRSRSDKREDKKKKGKHMSEEPN